MYVIIYVRLIQLQQIKSQSSIRKKCKLVLPVLTPTAPIRTAGTTITMHPNEAAMERIWAFCGVLHAITR